MATLFIYRGKIHIEYRRNNKPKRENLKLIDTKENWKRAQDCKKEAELLYESYHNNSNFKKALKKEIETKEISLMEAVEKYQGHISTKSASHQMNFVYAINGFLKIINESTKIQNIQSKDLTMYLNTLKKTVSNGTQRTYYTYIKLFFNYLVKEDLIDKSPCRNVDPPPEEEKEIIVFKEEVIKEIFEYSKERDTKFYIIMKFLLLTGFRPNDILNLYHKDINLNSKKISLKISKTKSFIEFPIYPELEKFISEELNRYFPVINTGKIFSEYTVNCIGQKFRRMKKILGLVNEDGYNLKTFRKTFGSNMIKSGVRMEYVGHIMGHKKLQTTKKYYVKIDTEDIREEIINSKPSFKGLI